MITALIIIAFWLFYLCCSGENTLTWSIRKRKSAICMMDVLIAQYNLDPKNYKGKRYKIAFPRVVLDALTIDEMHPVDINAFNEMRSKISQVLDQSFIWNAATKNDKTNPYTVCYKRLKTQLKISAGQKRVARVFPYGFSIIFKDAVIWIYPKMIILETTQNFSLIAWADFECNISKAILLKEEKNIKGNHGVTPYSTQYLHMNNDGSRDQRYKVNPSYPLYLFTPLTLKHKDDIVALALRKRDAITICEAFNAYKKFVNNKSKVQQNLDVKINYNPESIMNTIIWQS